MARKCTVCIHSERPDIEQALVDHVPLDTLAKRYGLSRSALQRHRGEHIPQSLVRAAEERQLVADSALLDRVRGLLDKAMSIFEEARSAKDRRTALFALREARQSLELFGKISGELTPAPVEPAETGPYFIFPPGTEVQVNMPRPGDRHDIGTAPEPLDITPESKEDSDED